MNAIDRANAAKRLKSNPDFIDLIADIEAEIFREFRNTKIGDDERLQSIHTLSHGLRSITSKIDKYIEIANYEISSQDEE